MIVWYNSLELQKSDPLIVCIAVPCFLGLGWPGNPSPAEAPVPNLRAPVVSFQLLGLPAGAVVREFSLSTTCVRYI